jgi:hypothetical protein
VKEILFQANVFRFALAVGVSVIAVAASTAPALAKQTAGGHAVKVSVTGGPWTRSLDWQYQSTSGIVGGQSSVGLSLPYTREVTDAAPKTPVTLRATGAPDAFVSCAIAIDGVQVAEDHADPIDGYVECMAAVPA